MITNKRNTFLETSAFMFLVTRDDVSHTRRTALECNEHYYELWIIIQREFNIQIVQKSIIRLISIFMSG